MNLSQRSDRIPRRFRNRFGREVWNYILTIVSALVYVPAKYCTTSTVVAVKVLFHLEPRCQYTVSFCATERLLTMHPLVRLFLFVATLRCSASQDLGSHINEQHFNTTSSLYEAVDAYLAIPVEDRGDSHTGNDLYFWVVS